ncbi:UDP-glucose 4-epimerase GalE [bacterium]|nr:UDP-glucose 4-epimerase GalE [bacterium]
MSVLVAGGAGYIGSVTAKVLLGAGHKVVVYDNLSRGHRAAVPHGAAFVEADLADAVILARTILTHKVEAVMHFAAHSLVPESMQKPELYFGNNVATGLVILEAMRAAGCKRIVFSSTCATFGVPERVPIAENDRKNPESPYGESKLMFERMLHWYVRIHGFSAVVLRYFNAAGAFGETGEDHRPETHLIPLVLQVALGKREAISVYGTDYDTRDGAAIRDYIHVRDLAEAHRLALEKAGEGFEHYNLGAGKGYTVREVIDAARRVTGHAIPSIDAPRRAGDPPELVASLGKIRDAWGFEPAHPEIDEIVTSAWQWAKAHPDGYPD